MNKAAFASIILASAFAAGAVFAEQAAMDARLTNTIEMQTEDGSVSKLYMNEDGTYMVVLSDGTDAAGVWEDNGAETCYTRTEPEPLDATCSENPAEIAVGASWEATNANGEPVTVTIVEGR